MEAEAHRAHPGDVTVDLTDTVHPDSRTFERIGAVAPHQRSRHLVYRHQGLRVRGLIRRFPVEIHFWEYPYYDTYGLAPIEYPRVFADPGAKSKHRMPGDDSLCMWFPLDPPEKRWVHTDGLAMLLRLTADHLLCEEVWRHDGADERRSKWLSAEAPHGFPDQLPGQRLTIPPARRRTRARAS